MDLFRASRTKLVLEQIQCEMAAAGFDANNKLKKDYRDLGQR